MKLTNHLTVVNVSRTGALPNESLKMMLSHFHGRIVRFRDETGEETRGSMEDLLPGDVFLIITGDGQEHHVSEENILGIEPLSKEKFMELERD